MSHLARASAALAVLVLAAPAGALAAPKKAKHTSTVRTVTALPKTTPKNLSRKCGSSKSATRIRSRRTSRPTKQRIRTVTKYCNGGSRTVFTIKRSTITRTVPGATVTVPAPQPQPAQAPAPRKPFRLTLLHNNDGESKYGVGDSIAGYGGVTRFKTVLDRLRGEADAYSSADLRTGAMDKGTVTISSGDNFLAGLNLRASFQKYDAGNGPFYDSIALDRIGYDAITIGNHEYDFGPSRLAELISGTASGVPFLSANTDFGAEPGLKALRDAGRIADSTVVYKGGQPIGIIGVTTPDVPNISSPGSNVRFLTDVAGIVNAEAARLTAAGVNKIILSSHLQNIDYEIELVKQLRGVDIVISGGGDEVLANPNDLIVPTTPATVVKGAYPALAKDASERDVPVVTTQGEYRYVGRLTTEFDAGGNLVATDVSRSGPVRVSATPATPDYVADEDPVLRSQIIAPLDAYKAVLAANVIGTTEVQLTGGNPDPIRLKEANLGNLVADSFVFAANRTAAAEGRAVANVGFSNGGGIRTSIAGPGNISEKSTFDVLPFDNVIVTVPNFSAQRLKELMEWGVARVPTGDGRFPQISGFELEFSAGAPAQVQDSAGNVTVPGQRVRTITLDDGTKLVENGAVVAGAPSVNIATTNFTAGGGDNYPFRKAPFEFAHVPAAGTLYPYQASLFDFITTAPAGGGLGGVVTAARYPVGGSGRITQLP